MSSNKTLHSPLPPQSFYRNLASNRHLHCHRHCHRHHRVVVFLILLFTIFIFHFDSRAAGGSKHNILPLLLVVVTATSTSSSSSSSIAIGGGGGGGGGTIIGSSNNFGSNTRINKTTTIKAFVGVNKSLRNISSSSSQAAAAVEAGRRRRLHRSLFPTTSTSTGLSSSRLNIMSSSSSNQFLHQRLESPSAERNKKPIWDILSSKILIPQQQFMMMMKKKKKKKIINILEIAAGSGVHTEYFVSNLLKEIKSKSTTTTQAEAEDQEEDDDNLLLSPSFMWYPTDPTIDSRESIQSYINDESLSLKDVVTDPIELTLDSTGIQSDKVSSLLPPKNCIDLIVCINMIHISSWDATIGLMKLANKHLRRPSSSSGDDDDDDDDDGGYLYCYGPYKVNGNAVQSNL